MERCSWNLEWEMELDRNMKVEVGSEDILTYEHTYVRTYKVKQERVKGTVFSNKRIGLSGTPTVHCLQTVTHPTVVA